MHHRLIAPALVASLVGFGSTIALVIAAAQALGATAAQTASWIMAVCLAKAVGSAFLSGLTRIPVLLAWSTPGAAVIAATSGLTMAEGVGAFVFAGLLTAAAGLIGPLGKLVARIPDPIAAGMLAGVLLPFCLRGAEAAAALPQVTLPMILAFVIVRLWNPALAVLAGLAVAMALAFALGAANPMPAWDVLPRPVLIWPEFRLEVLIGLGLPLFLVTMAGQNLPGFATLRAFQYDPPVRAALTTSGGISAFAALFGSHPVSMAAITAAICLGPDVDPDPRQRWRVGLVFAVMWAALGLASPAVLALLQSLPPPLMTTLVALALLAPLATAASGAMDGAKDRFPALVTLVVTASGTSIAGIGGAFWGLVLGLILAWLQSLRRP